MKTRYHFLSLLLLFCATLMAQSKKGVEVIAPVDIDKSQTFFTTNDVALISDSDKFHIYRHQSRNPCKVFIGVGTLRDAETGGLKVDYTVDNTPATTYGVQAGDIILTLDNVPVHSQNELERERDKHAQGEAFTLNILRGGSNMTIQARFKECSAEEQEQQKEQNERAQVIRERFKSPHFPADWNPMDPPILGIYKDEAADVTDGIVIGSVIEGKGAAAAGLKAGDVIIVVDGQPLTVGKKLNAVLMDHKPGEQLTVVFLRDGQRLTTEVVLSKRGGPKMWSFERDPCKVFIGVYISDFGTDGKGVRISGVIDGTPAKAGNLQSGDIITALDDQPVHSNAELVIERNKHQPGDQFRMTVLRDGNTFEVEATFKACPKDKETPVPVTPEVVELGKVNTETPQVLVSPETTLELDAFDAYPNPTLGPVNIQFEAKAVPTTIRITDISGKMVYNNQLKQFSGTFNEQINLDGNSPGIYTVSIQQEGKVFVKKIILLSRV